MYDRRMDDVAWTRLQDVQREAENRRLRGLRPVNRQALGSVGQRIWQGVGLKFGWLPAKFSDVA